MKIKKILSIIKNRFCNGVIPFFKMLMYNSICKLYIELFGTHDRRKMKYRISLCLIFKNEAPFLKEWLDYHLAVGVDHFYLYNNNSDDNYFDVLKPYVDVGLVNLVEWPDLCSQFKAYKHCYDTYRTESNWISFLDADEFICPRYDVDINMWLKKFGKYPAVTIPFLMFGTSGNIKHDYSKTVIEQYTQCWDHFYHVGKCIINTRYNIANFNVWHLHHHTYMKYPFIFLPLTLPAINQFGKICLVGKKWGNSMLKVENSTIQINHYYTKALDIYDRKAKGPDVLFEKNLKSDYKKFYMCEDNSITRDYTILRFLSRMLINRGVLRNL